MASVQHLLRFVPISNKVFVEFGVENYLEANTRFLMVKDNWAGLVMDGSQQNIDFVRQDDISWRFNLKAQQAFITKENINDLIRANGISGEIGLLSIDIDGNDYWVWEAILCCNASDRDRGIQPPLWLRKSRRRALRCGFPKDEGAPLKHLLWRVAGCPLQAWQQKRVCLCRLHYGRQRRLFCTQRPEALFSSRAHAGGGVRTRKIP